MQLNKKITKCLEINLTKEVEVLYTENYYTLMEEIQRDTNVKTVHCRGLKKISIIGVSLLPKTIYRVNAIPINIPKAFFTEIDQTVLKFVWNHKKSQMAKAILRQKEQSRGIRVTGFRWHYVSIVIKTVKYWHKNRHIDQ